jgi:hypothetical protein
MRGADEMTADELARRLDRLRADLEHTRADYEQIMVHLAGLSSTVTDQTKRRALELFVTVVATDYELKVLLLRDLSDPTDREVWEKYLALLSWAAIEELPPRISSEYREAGRAFKDALKPIKSDADDMTNLTEIRNRVVAHRDLEGGDHWLAQWHLAAIANKHNGRSVLQSRIVAHTGTILNALRALGTAIRDRHPDVLPQRARSADG